MKDRSGVFLSHSHLDLDEVRKIRNKLEENGHDPIVFYLKCLTDDDEIEALVKREIDAREWFIFCNSENARLSKWVKSEREYIKKAGKKQIWEINLGDNEEKQQKRVDYISSALKVFVSYKRCDEKIADIIKETLYGKEFTLLEPEKNVMNNNGVYTDVHFHDLNNYDKYNDIFHLIIISDKKDIGSFVLEEIITESFSMGMGSNNRVIPVIIDNYEPADHIQYNLSLFRKFSISSEPTDEELENLVEHIIDQIHFDFSYKSVPFFMKSEGFQSARHITYPENTPIGPYTFLETVAERIRIPKSVTEIDKKAFAGRINFLVECYMGSVAEKFCIENKISYDIID